METLFSAACVLNITIGSLSYNYRIIVREFRIFNIPIQGGIALLFFQVWNLFAKFSVFTISKELNKNENDEQKQWCTYLHEFKWNKSSIHPVSQLIRNSYKEEKTQCGREIADFKNLEPYDDATLYLWTNSDLQEPFPIHVTFVSVGYLFFNPFHVMYLYLLNF